jgi:hypothetical protein
MFMPELSKEQYCAFGEFAYQFANLEKLLNWAIVEAGTDPNPRSLRGGFEDRVKALEYALPATINQYGFSFRNAERLGQRRNTMLHGEPDHLIRRSAPDAEGNIQFEGWDVSFNERHGTHIVLEPAILQAMACEARNLAERLLDIVIELATAKYNQGKVPFKIMFSGQGRTNP